MKPDTISLALTPEESKCFVLLKALIDFKYFKFEITILRLIVIKNDSKKVSRFRIVVRLYRPKYYFLSFEQIKTPDLSKLQIKLSVKR